MALMHGGMKHMAAGWEKSKKWADKYVPEIKQVVRQVAGEIIEVRIADQDKDQHEATDYIVEISSGDIACRVRDQYFWRFGDFTLRYSRPSGNQTELEKIKKGYARWYLYAWDKRFTGKFTAWVFVDLDKLRNSGLLDRPRRIIPNGDGSSSFVYISLVELWQHGCITEANEAASMRILERLSESS